MTPLNQPKSREREGFKDGVRGKELIVLPKQPKKEKKDCQDGESEIEPGEQLEQKNKGKRVCNLDVVG